MYVQEYAEKYAADQEAFFKDYAEAHAKLSNLGAKFDPPEVGYLVIYYLLFKERVLVQNYVLASWFMLIQV